MHDLSAIRERIDSIDCEISRLLLERLEVSKDVAAYKREAKRPVYDRTRERENVFRAAQRVPVEFAPHAAAIQSVLMGASREVQYRELGQVSATNDELTRALAASPAHFPTSAHVACQGVEGAYQQIAVDRMFKRPSLTFLPTFESVFAAVEDERCEFGVLPIENSTAGSVNHVFDLMQRHDFHIVRTARLRIDHNLLACPGTRKRDISIVYSHQQAISQCADYISHIPNCRVHVCENTAKAAEMVARYGRRDVAALASRQCAELYGLEVLEEQVQDNKSNYTRFACIAKDLTIYPGADRSTLMVTISHEPGALLEVLTRFYALGINLTKLESRPIAGRDFEFLFYFDIECPAASAEFATLMNVLPDACQDLRYLGSYQEVI